MAKNQSIKPVDSVTYNTRVRSYPDGTKQYYQSSRSYHRAGDEEKETMRAWRQANEDYFRSLYPDLPDWCISALAADRFHDGSSVERKEVDNMKRAKQVIYNIAKSNDFTFFATWTLNGKKVNRYDYDSAVSALQQWINSARQRKFKWLIVPEQHKDGAWHFHGLISGNLSLTPAINSYTGLQKLDKSGRLVYNIGDYSWGFAEGSFIDDPKRIANYMTKYVTKCITVPKGRKRYWVSYGLTRPVEEFVNLSSFAFAELVAKSRYFKYISNDWGNFWLAELDSES